MPMFLPPAEDPVLDPFTGSGVMRLTAPSKTLSASPPFRSLDKHWVCVASPAINVAGKTVTKRDLVHVLVAHFDCLITF